MRQSCHPEAVQPDDIARAGRALDGAQRGSSSVMALSFSRLKKLVTGLRVRLVLLIMLAVALPTLLFLRDASFEQENLLVAAQARVLRQTQNWADREHELVEQARMLVDMLAHTPALA